MNLKNSENIWVLGIFLGVIALISALLLSLFSEVVKQPIAEAQLRNINSALEQILPSFDNQPSENIYTVKSSSGMEITFFGAIKEGKLVGVAAQASEPSGYAGAIKGLVGLDVDGKIRAVLITEQNETPGLGANICSRKLKKTIFNLFEAPPEGLTPNKILDQFNGKIANVNKNWQVKKDGGTMEFVSGATVTCRAVTKLVSDIDRTYLANKATITTKLGEVK